MILYNFIFLEVDLRTHESQPPPPPQKNGPLSQAETLKLFVLRE